MANPVLGKPPCSDWFFLGQDFAVRSNLCIFVLERGRQIQHLQPKQWKKKALWILSFLTLKLREKGKKIEKEVSKMDEEDEHF